MVGRMTRRCLVVVPWLAAALALPGGVPASPARGDDDVVATMEQPADGQSFRIDFDQQLDGMIQGMRSGGPVPDLPTPVEMRTAAVDAVCGLSPAQVARCGVLADVLRATEEASIARLREAYSGRVVDLGMPDGQQEWQAFHQEFARVRESVEQATGPRGILSRLLLGMLDERQRGLWAEETRQRDAERLRDMLDEGLEAWVGDVGMTSSQRDAIAALTLVAPSRLDPERIANSLGTGSARFLFAYVLSTVDRPRIDELLDERQRSLVTKGLEEAGGMFRHIETNCLIDQ